MALPINRPGTPGTPKQNDSPEPEVDLELPDFDDEPVRATTPPRRPRTEDDLMDAGPGRNLYDDGDDPFSSLPISEVSYDEEEAPQRPEPKRPTPPPARRDPEVVGEDKEDEEYERERLKKKTAKRKKIHKRGYTDDTAIDEHNVKLKPFGSGRRKAKVGEFDKRKNLRAQSKIVQVVALGLMIILVLLGLKNALVPPPSLSPEEVQAIVTQSSGETNFPVKHGEGFAKDFVESYLTVDPLDPVANKALGYFYTGTLDSSAPASARSVSSDFKQRIVRGPTVYESRDLTDYSANYVIGSLVIPETVDSSAPPDGSSARWIFLNVNVYWDEETNSFTVTPNSPTVTTPIEVGDTSDLPREADIGSDRTNTSLTEDVRSVVLGYVRGYAISNSDNHVELDQYVIPDAPPELFQGLNKRYVLPEDVAGNVTLTAFPGATDNDIRVEVVVVWEDPVDSINKARYRSTYVMALERQPNGQYLVSRFNPKYFVQESD